MSSGGSDGTGDSPGYTAVWPTVLFLILAVALVFAVGYEAFTTQAVTAFGTSDFYEHSAVLRALLEDGFFPPAPMAQSDVGSPRFMPHALLLAAAGRLLSFDALLTMALASTVNVALFVIGIFVFFRALFRDPRAPLYGLVVLTGSWYHAWTYSNVYQLQVLFGVAAYPSQACVGLTMIALAIGIRVTRSAVVPWGRLAALTALLAYILLTHPVTAMMALTAICFLALTAPGMERRGRALLFSTPIAGGLLALLWPHFSVLTVILGTGGGHTSWVSSLGSAGHNEPRYVNDTFDLADLVRTMGLAIVGVGGIGLLLVLKRHVFIVLSGVAMLLPFLLNFVVRIPLGSRFILLAIFFLQVALVWMMLMISPGYHERSAPVPRPTLSRVVLVLLLLLMVGHNVRLAIGSVHHALRDRTPGRPAEVVLRSRRVAEIAGVGAVVLGHRHDLWPLPTFGVKIVGLHHMNPLIPDSARRLADTDTFLAEETTSAERDEIVRRYGVTHVLVRDRPAGSLRDWLGERDTDSQTIPGGYLLHSLRAPR